MSLTLGRGPFGRDPAGVFNFSYDAPAHVLYWEDTPRRYRAELGAAVVADSRRAKLMYETGIPPVLYLPFADLDERLLEPTDHATHCPFKGDASYYTVRAGDRVAENAAWTYPEPLPGAPPLAGYAALAWDAMDRWLEEDEPVFHRLRDPYHRVDVRAGSRHVRVHAGGETLAETTRPQLVFETGLPPRVYVPRADVTAALEPSPTVTRCPYKGEASYWSARANGHALADAAFSYERPLPEFAQAGGHLCFLGEGVEVEIDGEPAG